MTTNKKLDDATNAEIMYCSDKDVIKHELELKYPGAVDHVKAILKLIGDDPDREGLRDTPYRVVKSWLELYNYDSNLDNIMGTFFEEEIGDQTDEMVICKNISFFSTCEHHMIPFSGLISIGYLPTNKVIGVSKMVRLVEHFARRLQIQEKLGSQIADSMMQYLNPQGVGVIITAKHLCMSARGVKNQTSSMTTSSMRGKFKTQSQTRTEFLSLIKD